MVTILIIYFIGAIVTAILWWRIIPSGGTVTLLDIGMLIFLSSLSWISAIILFGIEYGDIVIFRKK